MQLGFLAQKNLLYFFCRHSIYIYPPPPRTWGRGSKHDLYHSCHKYVKCKVNILSGRFFYHSAPSRILNHALQIFLYISFDCPCKVTVTQDLDGIFLTMYIGLPRYIPPRLLGETEVRKHWSTKYFVN